MSEKKVLLLVGSPRKEHSTSNAIGQYLLKNFSNANYSVETIFIGDFSQDETRNLKIMSAFNESDVIILSYPLYVDSLPSPCIKILEYITSERKKISTNKNQIFMAAGNCGFYEKEQIANSLKVCSFFAEENKLSWHGGIAIGGGPQLQGKELTSLGGMTVKLRKALDLACNDIMYGNEIQIDEINKLLDPPEPRFLYFILANFGFKQQAKKNGIKNIKEKTYLE